MSTKLPLDVKMNLIFVIFLNLIVGGVSLHPKEHRLQKENVTTETPNVSSRKERQANDISNLIEVDDFCSFGYGDGLTLCSWASNKKQTLQRSSLPAYTSWTLSNGANSLWVGGPLNDTTGDLRGGYAFHETSSIPGSQARTAVMLSTGLHPTGSTGRCLKFWYSIDGLSANSLRVKVSPDGREETSVIWKTMDSTRGDWREAQALYTFTTNHSVIIEAVPVPLNHPFNIFRGHIAIDDLGIRSGSECIGLCSFEGGLCDWSNSLSDDFNWKLGRGTQNPITGPPRDHSSSLADSLGGAYIYIDSSFPRRPDDMARLESIDFRATDPNNPPCMRFFTYMSGKGVGTLRVILQDVETRRESVIWALARDQGSRWVEAQLPLSSNTPFKVIFEGIVGFQNVGDIALDDITIVSGPCSTQPTTASPPTSGDCTFEDGSCSWSNPSIRQRLDDLDFIRIQASELNFPEEDHTTRSGRGFYMMLEQSDKKLEGDRAWLVSPMMSGRRQIKCIAFWYLMFEPLSDDSDQRLGSMSAFMKREDTFGSIVLTPIWGVQNFQGLTWNYAQAPLRAEGDFQVVIEGVWGSHTSKGVIAIDDVSIFEGSCPTVPDSAIVRAGDCTFTRGACGWRNVSSDPEFYFNLASPLRRPHNIIDHTYGAPAGYIYFDIKSFGSRNYRLQLVSPVIEPPLDRSALCFSFWFSGFGNDPKTTLNIYQRSADLDANQIIINHNNDILIWSHSISGDSLDNLRRWVFGQVSLVSNSNFQIVIEGSSYDGGYALDDFKVYSGGCAMAPPSWVTLPGNEVPDGTTHWFLGTRKPPGHVKVVTFWGPKVITSRFAGA